MAQLWQPQPGDLAYIVGQGYRRVGARAFVLEGTPRIDTPRVVEALERFERRRAERGR